MNVPFMASAWDDFSYMLFGSLLAGSPVGLKSKRFVFEIILARENRGEGTGEEGGKAEPAGNPRVFEY